MRKPDILLVERGLNGWHGQGKNCSVTYYTNNLDHCLDSLADGAWIVDKEGCPRLVHGVVSGPMVDVGLPSGTVDRFTKRDKQVAENMLPALSGVHAAIASHAIVEPEPKESGREYGSLDKISLDLHIAYWRKLGGCKFGRYIDGKVAWEHDGPNPASNG